MKDDNRGMGRREDECWMRDDDRGMGEEGGLMLDE
jgi:hypothetical protein